MFGNNGTRLKTKFLKGGSKVPTYKLNKDNSFLLFPFEITLGAINSTEDGLRTLDNTRITDYSSFQRLFTGLENVTAQWEGAYKVTKKTDDATFLSKEYSVGRSFKGYIPTESLKASFEPSSISADFLAEFTEESFTIHSYEDLEEQDLFKLFIIPELKEFKWLYVSDAVKYFMPNGKLHHIEITLTTLNNKIAKSGRATEEFIHRSAPGEGYAFPSVDSEQNVTLDKIRDRDIPVTSLQIEMEGPAGFTTIFAYGRPTKTETIDGITKSAFNPEIKAPRLLLPFRMETPIPSPLNTRPSAETDYYVGKFKPTLEEYFGNFKKQIEASYNLEQKASFQGVLESTETLEKLQRSNPINQGSHQYNLWDPSWTIEVDKIYNTSTDPYTGNQLTLKGDYKVNEVLAHNIFGTSAISTLPLSVKQNITWSLSDIPLVGGFLSKITLGIPVGWRDEAIRVSMDSVLIVQPASLIEYANVLQGRSPDSKFSKPQVDLLTYTTENKSEEIEFSGINATGTIFKVGLSDRFTKVVNGKTYTFNTVDLGQAHPKVDDEGTNVDNPPAKLLWDETCKPTSRNADTPGYVIDATSFKALAKLEYRHTLFSNDTEVWSGTYQTNSKFTGSIRDWTNYTKMSNWKEDNNNQIAYPEAIVAPNPPNVQQPAFDFETTEVDIETEYNKEIGREDWYLWGTRFGATGLSPQGLKWYGYVGEAKNHIGTNTELKYKYENIVATFNTEPYGGINNFKNNYKELKLLISERTRRTQFKRFKQVQKGQTTSHITLDVEKLITQGTLSTVLFTDNYDEQRWIDDKNLFLSGNLITNTKDCKISLRAETDADLIKIICITEYKTFNKQTIKDMSGEFDNQPEDHSGTNVIDVWFNVDKATAVPVVIVPNKGGN